MKTQTFFDALLSGIDTSNTVKDTPKAAVNGKLVKDSVPLNLANDGKTAIFRTATPDEFASLLWGNLADALSTLRGVRKIVKPEQSTGEYMKRAQALTDVYQALGEIRLNWGISEYDVNTSVSRNGSEFKQRNILLNDPE